MKKNNFHLSTLGLIALIVVGCQSPGAYRPKNTDVHDLENHASVALMDKRVERSVTVSGLKETRLTDGRLEVKANIRNREARRLQVQVSCVFKDAEGFTTGDVTPWANLILTEKAQEGVSWVSMNNQAERYTVRIREAR